MGSYGIFVSSMVKNLAQYNPGHPKWRAGRGFTELLNDLKTANKPVQSAQGMILVWILV